MIHVSFPWWALILLLVAVIVGQILGVELQGWRKRVRVETGPPELAQGRRRRLVVFPGLASCSRAVHVVKDGRVTCECQGVSVLRVEDGGGDVQVTIYKEA